MAGDEKPWRRRVTIALYVFVIVNVIVSMERSVFDALGEMWVILFANGITIIASLVCILGVLCKKNTAILGFVLCAIFAIGVNVVIILVFNDVGVFKDKDSYLSLKLNDKHWWRNHGFLCYTVCNHGNDGTADESNQIDGSGVASNLLLGLLMPKDNDVGSAANSVVGNQECFASYVVIETAHAAVNILLMIVTIFLSFFVLKCKKRSRKLLNNEDDESFRYLGIGRYGGTTKTDPKRPSFYKLSQTDSFDLSSSSSGDNTSRHLK